MKSARKQIWFLWTEQETADTFNKTTSSYTHDQGGTRCHYISVSSTHHYNLQQLTQPKALQWPGTADSLFLQHQTLGLFEEMDEDYSTLRRHYRVSIPTNDALSSKAPKIHCDIKL